MIAKAVCGAGGVLIGAGMIALPLQILVYIAAVAGIVAGTLGALFFAGGALNPARPRSMRVRRGLLALLCLCGIVASATLGFVGVAAILYYART